MKFVHFIQNLLGYEKYLNSLKIKRYETIVDLQATLYLYQSMWEIFSLGFKVEICVI